VPQKTCRVESKGSPPPGERATGSKVPTAAKQIGNTPPRPGHSLAVGLGLRERS